MSAYSEASPCQQTSVRRHFLAASAATGLALSASASQENQAGNQKLIVGVMGTGGRGTGLATAFQQQPGVEVAYVCDADQGRAERAAAAVQKICGRAPPRRRRIFAAILDDKAVDMLVVATCNHWHAPAAILACAAGKHVYVEKPCSHNPREGELLVQAARKHRQHVQMGNQRRSWPKVIEAIEQVRKGAIGRAYLRRSRGTATIAPTIGRGKASRRCPRGSITISGKARRRGGRSTPTTCTTTGTGSGTGATANSATTASTCSTCAAGAWASIYPIRVTSSGGRYRFEDDQETPDTHIVSFEFEGRKADHLGRAELQPACRPAVSHVLFHGETGHPGHRRRRLRPSTTWPARRLAGATVHGRRRRPLRQLPRTPSAAAPGSTAKSRKAHKSTLLCHLGNIAQRTGRVVAMRSEERADRGRQAGAWRFGAGNTTRAGSRGCKGVGGAGQSAKTSISSWLSSTGE